MWVGCFFLFVCFLKISVYTCLIPRRDIFWGITKSCASAEGSHLKLWIRLIYSVIWKRQNFFARKFISGSVTQSEYLSGRWPRSKKGFWEPQFGFTQPFWPSRRIIPTFLSVSSPQRLIHLAGPSISFAHSVPLFFCLVILGSVLPSPRKITFHTETIPRVWERGGGGVFCEMRRKKMNFTWAARGRHSPHVQPKTHRHIQIHLVRAHEPAWPAEPAESAGARLCCKLRGEKNYKKNPAIHARTYSSSRMNTGVCSELGSASDQRRCDGCLMFYWSQTSFSVFFGGCFFLPEPRTLVENLLQRFEPRTQQALTEEVMLLMWHIWQKKKKWKWKNAAPELNSHNMLLLWF